MPCIKNAKIYVENEGIVQTSVSFDDKIQKIGEGIGEEIVLPKNALVVPGFIDQHVHGAGGAEAGDCSAR